MFGIGPPELLVVFLIILILFGAKRLPELARSLGKSINEFKSATQNIKNDLDFTSNDQPLPNEKSKAQQASGKGESKTSSEENKENLAG